MKRQVYLSMKSLEEARNIFFTRFDPGLRAGPEVIKTEEKGSDVNLAHFLLVDGFRKDYECAVVISNDSDLCTPIAFVRKELGLPVGVINPHKKKSIELKKVSKFFLSIKVSDLESCQFPPRLPDAQGRIITKPKSW